MDNLPRSVDLRQAEQQSGIFEISTKELVEQLIDFGRRQYPVIVLITAAAITLGLVYLFTTTKLYTAHATLLIDTTKMQVLQQQQQIIGELPLDAVQVETQIQVLKSDAIGLSVVKDLKLTEKPEFVGSQTGLIGATFRLIFSLFRPGVSTPQGVASQDTLTRIALGRLQAHRDIRRIPLTYALDISYTSPDPGMAATVANGIADAYLTDQLGAKYQASRRASKWLQDRIGELRDQAMAADRAVLEFKEKRNLVDAGGGQNGSGRLLVDQRVVDLNTAVAKARADVDEAKARLDRIQKIMTDDIADAAVTDSLNNGVINQLRTQYLEDDRRYHIFAAKYGEQHLAVINLKTQMDELRRSMADELARIAQSYKSNYEIAKSREESLEKSLAQQISGSQLSNRELVGLDELESRAKAFHAIHDSFLQRYMEVTQQQSLPITEARVITPAGPGGLSSPHTFRILSLSSFLGLILAVAAAGLRDSLDRVFRTARQVEQILKANCLAVIPALNAAQSSSVSTREQKSLSTSPGSTKELSSTGLFRYVIEQPLSSFAEGFRAVKVAADISGSITKNKVVGVTSSLPHEGKSTVSSNLAQIIAIGGKKVILVDGDLRNPSLTRRISPKVDVGLLEVLSGRIELNRAIQTDKQTGLAFLPAVLPARTPYSSDILASDTFAQLIERLRSIYDFVIIDLSPLAPIVDVRATTHLIDSYLFVIEWGRTRLNMVQRQASSAPEVFDRLLGVVLNKANTRIMDRYDDYYGRYYYKNNYYAHYGDAA